MALRFGDIVIKRRYGDKLYIGGWLAGLSSSDVVSVFYGRLGSDEILPIKSERAECLWFNKTAGWYSFDTTDWYFRFSGAGFYNLYIYDSTMCGTPVGEPRATWLMRVRLPRYQHQIIFDLGDPDLGDNSYLLEAEYEKYATTENHRKVSRGRDCFGVFGDFSGTLAGWTRECWLCQAVEFGPSGCWPFPWWVCPHQTEKTIYFRGECSDPWCRDTLHPLGIACMHLITLKNLYGSTVPYCPYLPCP